MTTLINVLAAWCALSLAAGLIIGPLLAARFQPEGGVANG